MGRPGYSHPPKGKQKVVVLVGLPLLAAVVISGSAAVVGEHVAGEWFVVVPVVMILVVAALEFIERWNVRKQ
ncbi:hypothetical protein [Jatrophihabitans sp.]|uniref:hypothetical protein n=1 Tax=Jatrophihabitans sp. TaxID=1932789 RepID=UPI0030C716BB|nr:hypothetical protein [Jatrophihabitans sp.]